MQLKIKQLHGKAQAPTYAHKGDVCFDLYAADDGRRHEATSRARKYGTGLAFAVPPGHGMFIFSRSGHGFNLARRLSNCVGVIDPGYTAEVQVAVHNDALIATEWPRMGDKIAQACIIKVEEVEFLFVDDLGDSERGAKGFGSSGA